MIDQWNAAVGEDSRLRGIIHPCGAITTRMTHQAPNTGNIVSVDSLYGKEMRSFWTVEPGSNRVLVGTDMDQLELKLLGHYANDPELTKALSEGNSDDGTDVHSLIQKVLEIETRKQTKTFEYALIYGAMDPKLGEILGGGKALGEHKRGLLSDRFPGLEETITETQKEAKKYKRLLLIDGSYAQIRRIGAALNTRLQGGGARVCKLWLRLIMMEVKRHGLDVWLVAAVHDEYQFDCHKDHAEMLGRICVEAAKKTGEILKTNVPLSASFKIGNNWTETH
jgi:DNA polymerase I-like protein with 3'-5' exonuclease and polymerase domains